MELLGKIWKSKSHWLIETPSLDLMTQGRTKQEALSMMRNAILELIQSYFNISDTSFDITINDRKKGVIGITATNSAPLLSLSLRRQREKSGTTIREAAERLGSTPNAYAQYERGKTKFSLDHYEKLRKAANPTQENCVRIT